MYFAGITESNQKVARREKIGHKKPGKKAIGIGASVQEANATHRQFKEAKCTYICIPCKSNLHLHNFVIKFFFKSIILQLYLMANGQIRLKEDDFAKLMEWKP